MVGCVRGVGRVRQDRDVDYDGNLMAKTRQRRPKGSGARGYTSAFDDDDHYELTALGRQFVHYAMTDLPLKIQYSCSTKLVEGTSLEMLSPFSVRVPGADSLELQFTSITAASPRPGVANRFGQPRSRSE